jgi:ATP-dependent helicase HrpB
LYPVSVNYVPPQRSQPIWEAAANQATQVVKSLPNGSVLVFMPGAYEIRRTITELTKKDLGTGVSVFPLHSSLTKQEQDEAIKAGGRKIIVSTNVAETSLTIPNIVAVIDSGQLRVSRYDALRGIQTLFTEPISQASAHQRAGRAGRTQDGACFRLWSEFEHKQRKPNQLPEIHRIDLAEILLALIVQAKIDLNTFAWFEQPEQSAIDRSLAFLRKLGALKANNQPTEIGEQIARIGAHPRIAKLLIKANELGCLPAACILAALVQGQTILFPTNDEQLKILRESSFGNDESDLLLEYNAWLYAAQNNYRPEHCSRLGINTVVAKQIEALAYQYLNHFNSNKSQNPRTLQNTLGWDEVVKLKKCVLAGFADFVAIKHRPKSSTCSMIGGLSGQLHADSTVQTCKLLVATELEETKTPTGVMVQLRKVTAIEESWLREMLGTDVSFKRTIVLDTTLKRVVEVTEEFLDDLLINSTVTETTNDDTAAEVLTQAILTNQIQFEQWDEHVEQFVRRLNFAAEHAPAYLLPKIDEFAKAFLIQQSIYGCRSFKDVQKAKLWPALNDWLRYEQRQAVELVAPESIELPHRKRPVKLRYDEKGDVILSETIQALYDCPLPITVAEGRVKVVFELLSPARRPVQITRDLDYFWKNSYLEIRKELKGRYPKHEWR